jgi:hypothetical protein
VDRDRVDSALTQLVEHAGGDDMLGGSSPPEPSFVPSFKMPEMLLFQRIGSSSADFPRIARFAISPPPSPI